MDEIMRHCLRGDQRVPNFTLHDYKNRTYRLETLMGDYGLMLGFVGDIWKPTSVRRILWLQRHVSKFSLMGSPIALLVREEAHTLYGFQVSSPLPVPFPLLADEDGTVHTAYGMDTHPGLLLIDRDYKLRKYWQMPDDRVWPRMTELVQAVQYLQAFT